MSHRNLGWLLHTYRDCVEPDEEVS